MSRSGFEETAMNEKTSHTRGPRRAGALAVVAAIAVLATACGGGIDPPPVTSTSGRPAAYAQMVALAQCMRSHGVPNFPAPPASGGFTLTTTSNGAGGAVDIGSSQVRAAYGACRHLLPGGGPNLARLRQQLQQKLQRALPGLLEFSRCMRSHGVPNYPDPPASRQGMTAHPKGAGINPASPQFLGAVRACRPVLPAGVSLHTHTSITVNGS
jgi:hypothetical protein